MSDNSGTNTGSMAGQSQVDSQNNSPAVGILFNYYNITTLVTTLVDTLKKFSPNIRLELISSGLDELTDEEKTKLESLEVVFAQPNLVTKFNLHRLPKLKWLHCLIAGVDLIVEVIRADKLSPSFVLTRNAAYFDTQMAEYVIGMVLSRERSIPELRENQRNRIWKQEVVKKHRALSEVSLGICGFGSIGKEIARAAKEFGLKVWALVRNLPDEDARCPAVDEYRSVNELGDLLSSCDYIVSIMPSTPGTDGFFDRNVLSNCKQRKSVFINIGRGNVISESTIIHALNEGWLGHAVLDVFNEEPLPSESPLWTHPEVTISPHCSGIFINPERFLKTATDNYKRYMKGEPLLHSVNWEKGY